MIPLGAMLTALAPSLDFPRPPQEEPFDRRHPHYVDVRVSRWVEDHDPDRGALPVRTRILAKGSRVRVDCQIKRGDTWEAHPYRMTDQKTGHTWIDLGFVPADHKLDVVACNAADGVFAYLDDQVEWAEVCARVMRGAS